MKRKEKQRGISLLSLIGIILAIIIVIIIIKNIPQKVFDNNAESQEEIKATKEKFSLSMMKENEIGKESSIEEIKRVFNSITQSDSYVETTTGSNIDIYTAEGTTLYFKNSKLYIVIVTSGEFEFNGIKIGESKDDVINAFYKEENTKEVISSDGTTIGQFLYGEYTIYNLKSKNITEEVEYGYIGNENTAVEGIYDYVIQYVYMEPQYKNEYASLSDDIAIIEFGIKEEKVVSIAIQVSPLE